MPVRRDRTELVDRPEPRSDAEIVIEVLGVLDPPADQREAIGAKVMSRIEYMRLKASWIRDIAPERFRSARKRKHEMNGYLNALRAAVRKYRALPRRHYDYDEQQKFREQLDEEIDRIRMYRDDIKVRHGHKPRDLPAEQAVQSALGLLCPRWWETSRTEWPSITSHGPWHQLSALLYEALVGQSERDHVLNYMAKLKRQGGPRLDDDKFERADLYPRRHADQICRRLQ